MSQDYTSMKHPEQGNLGTGLTPGCQGGKGAEEAVITDRYRAFGLVFFFSGAEANILKLGRGDGYPVNILKTAELYSRG